MTATRSAPLVARNQAAAALIAALAAPTRWGSAADPALSPVPGRSMRRVG